MSCSSVYILSCLQDMHFRITFSQISSFVGCQRTPIVLVRLSTMLKAWTYSFNPSFNIVQSLLNEMVKPCDRREIFLNNRQRSFCCRRALGKFMPSSRSVQIIENHFYMRYTIRNVPMINKNKQISKKIVELSLLKLMT